MKNLVKHNVSITECEEVFGDTHKKILEDVQHSKGESRFILLGMTNAHRLLFVVFTLRGDKIRIISARDLNKKEVPLYEKRA